MHGKQYSDEQNAAIRAVVREIVERDFENTKAPAAEALGLSAASLGDFLNGKKGVGNKLLSALARYTGQSTAARRAHGLRRGVDALARNHRRIRRCFLWVRLAMIAASRP